MTDRQHRLALDILAPRYLHPRSMNLTHNQISEIRLSLLLALEATWDLEEVSQDELASANARKKLSIVVTQMGALAHRLGVTCSACAPSEQSRQER